MTASLLALLLSFAPGAIPLGPGVPVTPTCVAVTYVECVPDPERGTWVLVIHTTTLCDGRNEA